MVLNFDNPWRTETETEAGFYGEQSKLKKIPRAKLNPPEKTNASYHFDTKFRNRMKSVCLLKHLTRNIRSQVMQRFDASNIIINDFYS